MEVKRGLNTLFFCVVLVGCWHKNAVGGTNGGTNGGTFNKKKVG
jgi:hypothetical protein